MGKKLAEAGVRMVIIVHARHVEMNAGMHVTMNMVLILAELIVVSIRLMDVVSKDVVRKRKFAIAKPVS